MRDPMGAVTDIISVFSWLSHTESKADVVAVWGVGEDNTHTHTDTHAYSFYECVLAELKAPWDALLHQLCSDTQEHRGPEDSTHTFGETQTHTQLWSHVHK